MSSPSRHKKWRFYCLMVKPTANKKNTPDLNFQTPKITIPMDRTRISQGLLRYKIPWNYLFFIFFLLFFKPETCHAYIGPGAGFAFISSFLILIIAFLLALLTTVSWPIRAAILFFKRKEIRRNSKVKRVIVIGFDGLDPTLCGEYIARDILPNFSRLSNKGCFRRLKTSTPAISPVAWSSFATGVNPGKHNIFDFFTRDKKNYNPILSSASIVSSQKIYKLGAFRLPINKTSVKLLRKSTSLWTVLGKSKIFSTILRVPITFPPEKFYGVCLSAMCTPDLLGTQGTYTLFSSEEKREKTANHSRLQVSEGTFTGTIKGPTLKRKGIDYTPQIALSGEVDTKTGHILIFVGKETISLTKGEYSPWIKLEFRTGLRKKITGMVRFLVTSTTPFLDIYMTPINIDPQKPTVPISHPSIYSVCLSKLHGNFSTLGLAEDTWALNDGAIDEAAFLEQAYDIFEERRQLLLDNIKRNKEGLTTLVFDTTDRIQHMFFRYLSDDHPANNEKDTVKFKDSIEQLYKRMDSLVGEVLQEIDEEDLLMIISDHGFRSFKWGVNLNTWLWKNGYLVTQDGAVSDQDWFDNIDWQKTQAFAYGLSGIFINTKGREHLGIVENGAPKKALIAELRQRLEQLVDTNNKRKPIRRVLPASEILKGPYALEAPDLFIGYDDGYRASWNCAKGRITDSVIEDNRKHWSGDHSIDPELVPGVFFSNWKLKKMIRR